MEAINIKKKYAAFQEKWSPHSIAELNGQQVLLAKVQGEFVWHAHEEEDELFHVIKGKLTVEFHDKVVELLPVKSLLCLREWNTNHVLRKRPGLCFLNPLALNIRGM